jgi:hypothetical protein
MSGPKFYVNLFLFYFFLIRNVGFQKIQKFIQIHPLWDISFIYGMYASLFRENAHMLQHGHNSYSTTPGFWSMTSGYIFY